RATHNYGRRRITRYVHSRVHCVVSSVAYGFASCNSACRAPKPMAPLPRKGQAQGDRSRHPILGDHLLIELEAAAWALRHSHEAVLERRSVPPHGMPNRIAVRIGEALKKGAVRHGGD